MLGGGKNKRLTDSKRVAERDKKDRAQMDKETGDENQ